MTADDRMSWGLIWDVLGVLEAHGYHQHDEQHTKQAVAAIGDLASIYEGTHDAHLTQVQPEPHDEPRQPVAEGDQDSVILTGTEVTTIVTALDLAADYERDRAASCADCPDQSCPTCHSRLRDAQAYDQMAAGMLQAAQEANATQPEPGSRAIAPDLAVPVADREAGQ